MLKYKLILKGVNEKIIDECLSDLKDSENVAFSVATKYLKNKEINVVNLQKCYKYLLSKGFTYDEVNSAISKLKED